jgi:hypothetical protein
MNSPAGVCIGVLSSLDDSAILKLENEIGRKRGSRLKLDSAQSSVLRFCPIGIGKGCQYSVLGFCTEPRHSSDVGSSPIDQSKILKSLRRRLVFRIFQVIAGEATQALKDIGGPDRLFSKQEIAL